MALDVITVSQSGTADVVGSDGQALQKAAARLRPGDTLSIGPGVYEMNNSLFVPSHVTVRGELGKTVLRNSRGVENALDDTLSSGWDISTTTVTEKEISS